MESGPTLQTHITLRPQSASHTALYSRSHLNDTAYDEAELIVLTWSGGIGTVELTLPDATAAKNLNRSKRIISDSSFNTSTHADLTPRAGQTLDGSSSAFRINKAYEGIKIWCNGTEWFIIQAKA